MTILKEIGKKNVSYIKIPKNGTCSINKFLKEKKLDLWEGKFFYNHNPLFVIQENNILDKDTFIFCVSRNPYTRFYSLFNQFKKYFHLIQTDLNFDNGTLVEFKNAIEENIIHPFFCTPQIEWISVKKNNIFNKKRKYFENLPLPYVNGINPIIKYKEIIKVDKIYKIENIEEFEFDFETKLSYVNYSKYSISKYKKSFTDDIKKFIIDYYEEDFKYFDYDFDFEKSIINLKTQRKNLLYYQ